MANKEKRFERVYSQDMSSIQIVVDKTTGVNYLLCSGTGGCGLTPLLNRDGTPMVTTMFSMYEE